MTVNTNGNEVKFVRTPEQRIAAIEEMVKETRDSQLRTEKMVSDFMTAIQGNPMLRAMGAKFGV